MSRCIMLLLVIGWAASARDDASGGPASPDAAGLDASAPDGGPPDDPRYRTTLATPADFAALQAASGGEVKFLLPVRGRPAHFEAEVYPNLRPLNLDVEIKIDRYGHVVVKQVRPYIDLEPWVLP